MGGMLRTATRLEATIMTNVHRVVSQGAQGDMLLRRVAAVPAGVKPIAAENGHHILTHSETGHHHVVLERPGVEHYSGMDVLRSYLVVPEGEQVQVQHLRNSHTHETLCLDGGVWEIIRQREHDITSGWKIAAD